MRSARFAILLLSLTYMSCGTLRLSQPLRETPGGWPMFGRNSLHTSAGSIVSSGLTKIWERNVDAGFGPFSPTIMGGIVFVGTLKGDIVLLDAENGDKMASKNFGGAAFSPPTVFGSTIVAALSEAKKNLFAYDLLTAKTVWSKEISDVEAPPALFDSSIFVPTQAGDLYRFGVGTGKEFFHRKFPAPIRVSPAVVDSLCVFGCEDGNVYAVRTSDGKDVWKYDAGSMIWCSASVDDSLIFVGDNSGDLLALRLDGALAFKYRVGGKILSMPVGDGRCVYFGCNDGNFYALDIANGALRWKVATGDPIITSAAQTRSQVIFGGLDEKLYVVDKNDGKVVQTVDLDGRIRTAPAIYGHFLAVCTDNQNVFGFKIQ